MLDAIFLYRYHRMGCFWYSMLLLMYWVQSFAQQPRLAVILQTLILAGQDILHFLLIFVVIVCSPVSPVTEIADGIEGCGLIANLPKAFREHQNEGPAKAYEFSNQHTNATIWHVKKPSTAAYYLMSNEMVRSRHAL